jgi:2,5-furandicarboxylate decarboxylase 1
MPHAGLTMFSRRAAHWEMIASGAGAGSPRAARRRARDARRTAIDVRLTPGGTCRYHLVVKIDKIREGEPKNIIMGAFGGHYDIKQVVVVDRDVDISSPEEIEWAIATRFQADRDMVVVTGALSSKLDPSSDDGVGAKLGFDATAPITDPSAFRRIGVKGQENVNLAQVLVEDPEAAFTRIVGEV